jgi:DNA-binding LytR/AlgR family response regulator
MSIRTVCVATPAQRLAMERLVEGMPEVDVLAWVNPRELAKAIEDVMPQLVLALPESAAQRGKVREPHYALYGSSLVALPVASGIEVRNRLDVVRIQGDAGYARVICEGAASVLLSKPISHCQKMFREDHGFVRVHRSAIVNMRFVRRIVRRKAFQLLLTTGDTVEVGDRYREQLYAYLEIASRKSAGPHSTYE